MNNELKQAALNAQLCSHPMWHYIDSDRSCEQTVTDYRTITTVTSKPNSDGTLVSTEETNIHSGSIQSDH